MVKARAKRKIGRRRFMTEPEASTTRRTHAGLAARLRGSLGSSSPSMRTKPPRGSQLMVYSVSPICLPHSLRWVADAELKDLDAGHLGREEMAKLVDHDQRDKDEDKGDDGLYNAHARTAMKSVACRRAHSSAARTSSMSGSATPVCLERTASTTSGSSVNLIRPSRKWRTAISSAAATTAGKVSPRRPASRARPNIGKRA